MNNVAIIGLGRLGTCMLRSFAKRRADIIAIDRDDLKIQWARDLATDVVKADAINFQALQEILPQKLECAVVDLGRNQLERSILCTNYLFKMKIPKIIVHAASAAHAEILQIVGATKIVFPEEEAAERLTGILAGRGRLDFFPVSENFSVIEVPPPKSWIGKSLQNLDIRKQMQINVVAVRTQGNEANWRFAGPNYEFDESDIVLVAGTTKSLERTME